MAFAGLWEGFRWPSGEVTRTFCIITTSANEVMQPIHDRMPVVLEPEDWPVWLGETTGNPSVSLHPPAEEILQCWPISTKVNCPKNNDAMLLDPVTRS